MDPQVKLRYVSPDLTNSFNCPYQDCSALAHQTWFQLYTSSYENGSFPFHDLSDDVFRRIESDSDQSVEQKVSLTKFFRKAAAGKIFHSDSNDDFAHGKRLFNLDVCKCFSCGKFSVWSYGKLLYPVISENIPPNSDLSDDIKRDFIEASEILHVSPRGSAALLRLCVQKLCAELGEKGKNVNDDIASLVKKGLSIRIQQALDIVRVIGNEAVHPGQLDLKDDAETATKLFGLVNLIAESMISQPKAINELFASLPETKRLEITRRDK